MLGFCVSIVAILAVQQDPKAQRLPQPAHDGSFSPSAKSAAFLFGDGKIHLSLLPNAGLQAIETGHYPRSVVFSDSGRYLAALEKSKNDEVRVSVWLLQGKMSQRVATLTHGLTSPEEMFDVAFCSETNLVVRSKSRFTWFDWVTRPKGRSYILQPFLMVFDGHFLPPSHAVAWNAKLERVELYKVSELAFTLIKLLELEVPYPDVFARAFVARDLSSMVSWNWRDETIEVRGSLLTDFALLDTVKYFRRRPKGSEGMEITAMACLPDRSLVIVSYADLAEKKNVVAFFPREDGLRRRFGLDPAKKDSHLELVAPRVQDSKNYDPPKIVLSPDGRSLILTGDQFGDRIWDTSHLVEQLLQDPRIRKRL